MQFNWPWTTSKSEPSETLIKEQTDKSESVAKSIPGEPFAFMPFAFGNRFKWTTQGTQAYNNKIFYTAMNILVGKLVETPIIFSKKKEATSSKYKQIYNKNQSNENRRFVFKTTLDEVSEHPLKDLFDAPNRYASGIEMMEDFWYNYGFGDGYLWFEPLGEGYSRISKPIAIHSLARYRVTPIRSGDNFDIIAGYEYLCSNGKKIPLPKEQVLRLKHWNPNIQEMRGLGVDQITAMDVSLDNANNIAQGAAFVNGGRGTLFSSDITNDGEERMTAEQMDILKETMQADFAGAANNRKQHWTNGYVRAESYGDTLAEMELDKTSESRWKYIFATIGIPWSLAPITTAATDNNISAGYKGLVTNTIIGILHKFDQKLTQIIQQWFKGIVAVHDITEFSELAPDLAVMKAVFGSPFISVDENRAIFNFDAVGGEIGKAILIPSNLMKIEDVVSPDIDTPDPNELDDPEL